MLLSFKNITFDTLQGTSYTKNNIAITVARLDKIHNDVSGNKIFKLYYFVNECLKSSHKTMLTFGGAYSNHLVATAYVCSQNKLKSIGIVRGEAPAVLSHTLLRCQELGMHLTFISRKDYQESSNELHFKLKNEFGNFTMVPEGGYNATGAEGASLIMDAVQSKYYTHICTAVGTATTLAGLLRKQHSSQKIIAVPVIKNMTDIYERINYLNKTEVNKPEIFGEYHFGGYAKYTDDLINSMNRLYEEESIPTDFVYTGKMMYAVTDKLKAGYFPEHSKILCLHTGGLQGNKSLKKDTLIY